MLIPFSHYPPSVGVSTPWDVTNMTYAGKSLSITSQVTSASGLFIGDNGSKMYVCCLSTDKVYQYNLSTSWDISTASHSATEDLDVSGRDNIPRGLFFKDDGTEVYFAGGQNDKVYQYSLSAAWDLSTATFTRGLDVSARDTNPSVSFGDSGSKMYILGISSDTVYQYSLSTAWDISSATYDSKSFSLTTDTSNPYCIFFKDDGTKMFVADFNDDLIYQFTLSTAWDVSTASYDSISGDANSESVQTSTVFIKGDGEKLYLTDYFTADAVYQYNL